MTSQFTSKKFLHIATGARIEGEVVLESSLSWQVAVGGKIQVLNKSEWSEDRSTTPRGGFEDIFSMFGSH